MKYPNCRGDEAIHGEGLRVLRDGPPGAAGGFHQVPSLWSGKVGGGLSFIFQHCHYMDLSDIALNRTLSILKCAAVRSKSL